MNYADFYRSGPYRRFRHEVRCGGSLPVRLILADQHAHCFSDPPTEDLLIGLTLGGSTRARWRWGGKWREVKARRAGDIGISPTGVRLDFEIFDRHRMLLCELPLDGLRSLASQAEVDLPKDFGRLQGPAYWQDPIVRRLLTEMWEASGTPSPLGNLLIDGSLQVILAQLIDLSARVPHRRSSAHALSAEQKRKIRDLVESAISGDLRLHRMASEVSLPVRVFQDAFKRSFGMTVHRYVVMKRVELAKHHLRDPAANLASLSVRLGFADQSHFTKVFSRETGETPARYRKGFLTAKAERPQP